MKIQDSVVLVTGAGRGLGRAFLDALLARGARKVYAAARDAAAREALAAIDRGRVVAIPLDVTSAEHVAAAAEAAPDVQLLVNNAGTLASYSVLDSDPAAVRRDMDVNFFGALSLARAFAPALERAAKSGGGAMVNVLSVVALASMPPLGGYSASKAAAWSLTQSLRAELGKRGVRVHGAFPGPIDTDMIRSFDMPKTSPADVARSVLDAVESDLDDVAPDPMSREVLATFRADPAAVAKRFAA